MSYSITRQPHGIYPQEAVSSIQLLLMLVVFVTLGVEAHEDQTSSCTDRNPTEEVADGSCLLQQMRRAGPANHQHAVQMEYVSKTQTLPQYAETPPPDVSPVWKVANSESLPYVPHNKNGPGPDDGEPLVSGQDAKPSVAGKEAASGQEQIGRVTPKEVGSFAYSSPRSIEAGRLLDANGVGNYHEKDHHSIFMLPYRQLDCVAFWLILVCMMAFTILIDRCENALTRWCKNNKTEWILLQRFNAKLMMFGVVGLGVFIGANLVGDIPEHYFQLLEFVDILCSLGAIGVIVIAAILWMLRRIMERRWAVLERGKDDVPRRKDGKILTDQATMRQFEWSLMSRKFRRHQQLPSTFSYLKYLKECLAKNICDLMDLNVWSWVFLFILSLCGLFVRSFHDKPWSSKEYEIAFLVLVWCTFFLFVLVQVDVNSARAHLRAELGIKDHTQQHLERSLSVLQPESNLSETSTVGEPDHPKATSWAWRTRQILQVLSLGTAFEAAFYWMNVRFNLMTMHYRWWWRLAMATPMFLNFFCMLPMIISRFTMVEAYFSPDHDAIDAVVHSMRSHQEDLRFLHHLWLYKGKPVLSAPLGKDVRETEFGDILRQNGIQVSQERLKRLFHYFDRDNLRVIDLAEVNDMLCSMKNEEQNPTMTGAETRW